ncbi:DUF547 domain-containing protein [Natronocalculus amylovorans]|uniref:DUF547 domain-containing protein n=1 Tax=Natronocalculus amylovorans TaxID=2917812 RepID=A0AAE3K9B9_9EURY|nr:DUF547 domain-containing protein [Natronocalculus amylovorans]MCL9815894.1 DUF547 domain-containing protein [Natronocalculus amylovorans]
MTSIRGPGVLDPTDPQSLAERSNRLLAAVRKREETDWLVDELETYDRETIDGLTDNQDAARTFWINIYNAFVQLALRADRTRLHKKRAFFGDQFITIGGVELSLDEIEHGIIRSEQWSLGLGYLGWPFYRDVVSEWALETRDYRIHFAINCGAVSCPPIIAYTASSIADELDVATRSYLEQEVTYDPKTNVARLPRLCLWYRGDFGGRSGLQTMLEQYDIVPPNTTPTLRYNTYDWSVSLNQFKTNNKVDETGR